MIIIQTILRQYSRTMLSTNCLPTALPKQFEVQGSVMQPSGSTLNVVESRPVVSEGKVLLKNS